MAKAAPIPGLTGDEPYASAAAMVVEVRTREVDEHASGVLDTSDIERVHDMRVATRRLRAALEVFAPCFPRHEHKAALREVKRLADALGERRDRDVTIAALERFSERLAAPDRPGLASLISRLRTEQETANRALAEFVAPERLAALRASLLGLARAATRSAVDEDTGAEVEPDDRGREDGASPQPDREGESKDGLGEAKAPAASPLPDSEPATVARGEPDGNGSGQ